jgi:hypothetical protein
LSTGTSVFVAPHCWVALCPWLVACVQGVLAAVHAGMSDTVALLLESTTTAFAVVFTWEAAVKLLAIGPAAYFREGWNRCVKGRCVLYSLRLLLTTCVVPVSHRFDFIVVVGSNVGIGLTYGGIGSLGSIASVFRAIRVLR